MRELSDAGCDRLAVDNGLPYATGIERELIRAGYAAGYRAAQAEAGIKPGPLDPCPNYGAMPPSLDRQPAATPSSSASEHLDGTASAVTDGPAADPIADLCARLRRPIVPLAFGLEAADALERLARERDDVCNVLTALRAGRQDFMRRIEGLLDRAERAEAERDAAQRESEEQARLLGMSGSREAALLAERDTLRAVVRAADAMRLHSLMLLGRPDGYADYDRARAKVTLP